MFDEIGGMQNILHWIEHELNGGSRLIGFGHRVYRTRDPRADTLKDIVGSLDQSTDRMQFAEALERALLDALAAKYPNRRLDTNVEYYTVLVLDGVGLPRELFTLAFAIGRRALFWQDMMDCLERRRLAQALARDAEQQAKPDVQEAELELAHCGRAG